MHWRLFHAMLLLAVFFLTGCAKNMSSELTKKQLEEYVTNKCSLKAVELEAKGDGKFSGNGIAEDGKVFKIEATQDNNHISWNATHDELGNGGAFMYSSRLESR